jgi:pimeloyl-ACP methyl ester carboxylesterase
MKRIIVSVSGLLLGGLQAGLMYFPQAYSEEELDAMRGDGLVELPFETAQGQQVAFYKAPAEGEPEKVWLVFGGNGARAASYRDLAANPRFGYLFVDYPGYGKCEGKASPRGIDANIAGALEALAEMIDTDMAALRPKVCAFGHSLGAAAALRAAVEFELVELVLVAPFTTMKEMAELAVGKVLSKALLHRYDNIKALAALVDKRPDTRVTLFHGTRDEIVPVAMGRRLATPYPDQVVFRPVEGADHNAIVSTHRVEILAALAREK